MADASVTAGTSREQHAPPATGSADHHSRRALLRGAADLGAVLALGVPPAIAGEAVDPHPTWWREAQALCEWLDGPDSDDVEDEARTAPFARMCDLHDLIAETPARTAAGAA